MIADYLLVAGFVGVSLLSLFFRRFLSERWRDALLVFGVVGLAVSVELWLGRVPWCKCGYIKLWHGVVFSSENSQHISDWYTFSHIIHGFIFYWIARKLFPRGTFGLWLILATIAEAAWEILENTSTIINRYREVTISLDYYGDSILNSTMDILAMLLGFWLARKLPVGVTVALAIIMEVFVGYYIRDNLALNIIMLIYPFDAILRWQSGG